MQRVRNRLNLGTRDYPGLPKHKRADGFEHDVSEADAEKMVGRGHAEFTEKELAGEKRRE